MSRSISARANWARNCLFPCAKALLLARRTAWMRAARTHLPHTASLMTSACATCFVACPSCTTRRTASVRKTASYLVLGCLSAGFAASITRESYFLRIHFCPTTSPCAGQCMLDRLKSYRALNDMPSYYWPLPSAYSVVEVGKRSYASRYAATRGCPLDSAFAARVSTLITAR